MNFARITFDPLAPWPALAVIAGLIGLGLALYALRGGHAWISRAVGFGLILLACAQPMIVTEKRAPVPDIAAVIIDRSESIALAKRDDGVRRATELVMQRIGALPGVEARSREAPSTGDGTPLIATLEEAMADIPRDRIAGAILITDGQAHDVPAKLERLAAFGPVHAVIVGDPDRGDRRLTLLQAPAFGIVGDSATIEARLDDPDPKRAANITITIDGAPVRRLSAVPGKPFRVQIRTPKRGPNMVQLEAEAGPQEITLANNRAAFSIDGVRDRLRVLLVTGEPYAGARVWRNLLKSDPSVDLVHFTILRPPEKQDFTPIEDLALIAFPTEELFVDKLSEFDLIIFDRYRRRSILQLSYFENIARRVEAGGAIMVVAGPYDAGFDSVFQTPLAAILPSQPTGRVTNEAYRPRISELGARHPVTRDLPNPESWGRWKRIVDARAASGRTLLVGAGDRPLLVIDRAGRGRVAQLWSDQAWLWARGADGGGPHAELLRRLAHWLMQEPELDDERLALRPGPEGLTIERSTLARTAEPVTLIDPAGARTTVTLAEEAPGVWRARRPAERQGLYEGRSGDLRAFAAVGPLNPKEAVEVEATAAVLKPVLDGLRGKAVFAGERGGGVPEIRQVAPGGAMSGPGWIGFARRSAYTVQTSAAAPLVPGIVWALLAAAVFFFSWRREAR